MISSKSYRRNKLKAEISVEKEQIVLRWHQNENSHLHKIKSTKIPQIKFQHIRVNLKFKKVISSLCVLGNAFFHSEP